MELGTFLHQVIEGIAVFDGELEKVIGSFKRKFAGDVRAMGFDRPRTDEQFGSDLFSAFVFGDGFENAPFSSRQIG